MDYLDKPDPQTFIAHHGIKGQKWGVRRFQNEDVSLMASRLSIFLTSSNRVSIEFKMES